MMNKRTVSFFLSGMLVLGAGAAAAPRTEWKAGAAAAVITPTQPIWMSGYAARTKPSEGTALDLFAKALALEDRRGNRTVIVTTDLLGVVRSLTDAVAQGVEKRHGLKRERVLFTSSHTHAGPVIRESLVGMYDMDEKQKMLIREYTARLQEQLVSLVGAALADMGPARLSFARGHADFAANRRAPREKGVVIGVNPQGPVEREVPVLRVERPDGKLRAILMSYACHNTTLGAEFFQFHGDYAGEAQHALEKAHPGAVAMFMSGHGADANPHPRGTLELAKQHGATLAAAVDKVLAAPMKPLAGPLRAAFDRVPLPFSQPLPREEWQKRLEGSDIHRRRQARMMLAILDEKGSLPTHYEYPIQVLQFGRDLTMIALAGEVVVDYNLRLKRELGAERVWNVGYANDVFAYIVSRRVLEEGGYEPQTSMIYYGQHGPWAPEVEETLVAKVHELVKRVK